MSDMFGALENFSLFVILRALSAYLTYTQILKFWVFFLPCLIVILKEKRGKITQMWIEESQFYLSPFPIFFEK